MFFWCPRWYGVTLLSLEEDPPFVLASVDVHHQLREHKSERPDVGLVTVVLAGENDLWSSVHSCHYATSYVALIIQLWTSAQELWHVTLKFHLSAESLLSWRQGHFVILFFLDLSDTLVSVWERPRHTEVANENATLIVDKHISWFNVTVDDICFMNISECAQSIVQDDLDMLLA